MQQRIPRGAAADQAEGFEQVEFLAGVEQDGGVSWFVEFSDVGVGDGSDAV